MAPPMGNQTKLVAATQSVTIKLSASDNLSTDLPKVGV
jgi:hypothetical protein